MVGLVISVRGDDNNGPRGVVNSRSLSFGRKSDYTGKGKGKQSKGKGKSNKSWGPPPPDPPPDFGAKPINKLCFTELAAIWWSWYLCSPFAAPMDNSCPVQDKRVPAKTTFLFYDPQTQSCDDTLNERICEIPSDHWIILPVAANVFLTDFVSDGNTLDTPEGAKMSTNVDVDVYTNVTGKIDGDVVVVPRYESQDLCSLETVDLEGCTDGLEFADGWEIFSDGYWLRIPPLTPGNHTIKVSYEDSKGCAGTKYIITVY
jgi:hypothetical protein